VEESKRVSVVGGLGEGSTIKDNEEVMRGEKGRAREIALNPNGRGL
jgi:hypothetical protein